MLHNDDIRLKSFRGGKVLYITIIFETKAKPIYDINRVSSGEAEESLRTYPGT